MNATRIAILAVALVAAVSAAFLVRGFLGGGTPQTQAAAPPPELTSTEILVANDAIDAGAALTPDLVHWQAWPKAAVSPVFMTKDAQPDLAKALMGTFVRVPIVAGEPISETKLVHAGSASFMAATLTPGRRAVSISISAESGAGGFILPNDHVDVILTRATGVSGKTFASQTILRDVRVLAIDQVAREEKDQKAVVGKTALLELTPGQSEMITQAQASGTISLALRGIGETTDTSEDETQKKDQTGTVAVIRYGVIVGANPSGGGR